MTGLLVGAASSAADKRAAFRARLSIRLGCNASRVRSRRWWPKLVAEIGFEGVYVSGAVLSADLGLPDIGSTTLTEVAAPRRADRRGHRPADADRRRHRIRRTDERRAYRRRCEDAGLAGCHLEDQVNPKRCGHLDGKAVVPAEDMVKRCARPCPRRRDPNFVICARTDAAGIEGLTAAIDRAKAYADAGADMIFTEALADPAEFEQFRAAVDIPLLANMTEFGKSELLTADSSPTSATTPSSTRSPPCGWRCSRSRPACVKSLQGTQSELLERMQHRSRLYELALRRRTTNSTRTSYNFTMQGGPM